MSLPNVRLDSMNRDETSSRLAGRVSIGLPAEVRRFGLPAEAAAQAGTQACGHDNSSSGHVFEITSSGKNDDFRFTGERPEAWSFSCRRVGQRTPKEVTDCSGIWCPQD